MFGSSLPRAARLIVALAAGLGLAALSPAVAPAATTASMSGSTLLLTSGPEANHISFGGVGWTTSLLQQYLQDTTGIVAGAGCRQVDATVVECPASETGFTNWTKVIAHLGDGDDFFAAGIASSPGDIYAEGGNDVVYGTGGNDVIDGGPGNDDMIGNSGMDTVDGGPGDDNVRGGGGNDHVIGGPGRDNVHGDGPEVLDDGNDTIDLADGEQDQVQCGFGADIVNADALDIAEGLSCEDVRRTAAPEASGMTVVLGTAASRPRISTLLSKGYVFTCTFGGAGSLQAGIAITSTEARKLHLGRKAISLALVKATIDAETYKVTLRVTNGRYRTALRHAKRVKARLIVVASGAGISDSSVKSLILVR